MRVLLFIHPLHHCFSVVRVPVSGDEFDGDHFAINLPFGIFGGAVCDENRVGWHAQAARDVSFNVSRVGHKSDAIEIVAVEFERARASFNEKDDTLVVALDLDEKPACLLALEAKLFNLWSGLRRIARLNDAKRRRFLFGGLRVQGSDACDILLSRRHADEELLRVRAYLRVDARLHERVQNLTRGLELLAPQVNLCEEQRELLSSRRKLKSLFKESDGLVQMIVSDEVDESQQAIGFGEVWRKLYCLLQLCAHCR